MKIQYKVIRTGWAQATVEAEGKMLELDASYLSDPLAEITAGAIALLKGSCEIRFSFDEVPREYRWVISSNGAEEVRLSILEFPQFWNLEPDERGEVLLNTWTTRRHFAGEVLKVLDQLKADLGEGRYKEKWVSDDFPSERHELLKKLLG